MILLLLISEVVLLVMLATYIADLREQLSRLNERVINLELRQYQEDRANGAAHD